MIVGVGRYRGGLEVDDELSAAILAGGRLSRESLTQLSQMYSAGVDEPSDFVWVGVFDPQREEVERLGDLFGVSRLWTDDALNRHQRAKFELAADARSAQIVFKTLEYVEPTSDIETGQITVVVGSSYVLTVRWGAVGRLAEVRRDLLARPELLALGPLAAAQAIADAIVDDYLAVSEEIDRDVDDLEEVVFSPVITDDSAAIYRLKRENLEMRRAVAPLVPLAHTLVQRTVPGVPKELATYVHDVGDHLLRVHDSVESHDSLLFTMLSAVNSRQALQQNIDMRKIAAYAAILALPTAIAGIYGMNFEHMPELHNRFGYPAVLVVMLAGIAVIYRAFKRSGWL